MTPETPAAVGLRHRMIVDLNDAMRIAAERGNAMAVGACEAKLRTIAGAFSTDLPMHAVGVTYMVEQARMCRTIDELRARKAAWLASKQPGVTALNRKTMGPAFNPSQKDAA